MYKDYKKNINRIYSKEAIKRGACTDMKGETVGVVS